MSYAYKFKPFNHQLEGSNFLKDNKYFALFDEMGTGKSKTVVDAMSQMYYSGFLQAVILVCPNQVKGQWANLEWGQIVTHTPDNIPITISRIDASKPMNKWVVYSTESNPGSCLHWIVVNYEATRLARIANVLSDYMKQRDTAMVLDESIYIKNYVAQQTKSCIKLGLLAKRRYILNGTPLTKGPLDYFSQFRFLHNSIIGIDRYIIFRNRYAVMGGHKVNGRAVQVVGYRNLSELVEKIRPFYRRVTKEECLDLPKKLYQVMEVEMTEEQDKLYKTMKENLMAFVGGRMITAEIVLTKILRLSQLAAGFVTDHNDNEKITKYLSKSPKVDLSVKLAKESDKPTVIFCMFKPEVELLQKGLAGEGLSYGEIHGDVKVHDREQAIADFQAGKLNVMICQVATGGLGIELYSAGLVIFLSNSYSYAIRSQAEDRVHRTGLKHNVTYVDILATRHKGGQTVDHTIQKAISTKKDLAETVLELGELDGQI